MKKTKYLDELLNEISETMSMDTRLAIRVVYIGTPKRTFLDWALRREQSLPYAEIRITMVDNKTNQDLYIFGQPCLKKDDAIILEGIKPPAIHTTANYELADV